MMDSDPLTARENDVLLLLSQGLTNRRIASTLALSENTIKLHLASIFHKLNASSRTEAVAVAVRRGLVSLDGTAASIPPISGELAPRAPR